MKVHTSVEYIKYRHFFYCPPDVEFGDVWSNDIIEFGSDTKCAFTLV